MTDKKRERLDPKLRRESILNSAIAIAEKIGYQNVTRNNVADHAGTSVSLVSRYFETVPQLKRQIMRAAVASGNVRIVAQGLALRDPHAMKAPEELKQRAAKALA